ncbi:unnamed protein product [Didymodactylos carnosus]|uniref:Condensation domain-containing protein n=1 Tax=Didymodactylos carnosus TaxID=1234261 RepID=A0A814ZIE4_9BILA|nr:unnamed protein product [Didymodactylos carnosus]CAF1243326.1 unnamed protein product [Didymodactylos carnosus]CAF3766364.1 unnamed protein product [Didymodactylos carnosus]CAF4007580.1 unnamed protein product [Didymodactylos carnosus]
MIACASPSQERIWLDLYLHKIPVSIYNIPVLFTLPPNRTLSIRRLHLSIRSVIRQHSILRTKIVYDNCLKQIVQPVSDNDDCCYSFQRSCIEKTTNDDVIEQILVNEINGDNHFNLEQGVVVRCHVIQQHQRVDEDLLEENDWIIFNFHHIALDGYSLKLFFNDLNLAYTNSRLESNKTLSQFIDCKQLESIDQAKLFWMQLLSSYQHHLLLLPYDSVRINNNNNNVGRTYLFQIDNTSAMFNFISKNSHHGVTMFQLLLASYFLLLYKLTNQIDLFVGGLNSNRRHYQNVIGMFVNLNIYRLKNLNLQQTFEQLLLTQVQPLCQQIALYSYLPYQDIINNLGNVLYYNTLI